MSKMTLEKLVTMTMRGFTELRTELKADIRMLEKRMDGFDNKIDSLELRLGRRMDDLESRLEAKIVGIDKRLDYHAEAYSKKTDYDRLEKKVARLEVKPV